MKSVQRIISMILALSLILEFCPQAALATETEQTQETEIAVTARETTLETTAPAEAVTEPVEETATPTEETIVSINTEIQMQETASSPVALASVESGTCGSNLTWAFDSATGTLTISGTGTMNMFYFMDDWVPNNCPWLYLTDMITTVVVESGVTSIGDDAFCGCEKLTNVYLPLTVTKIGHDAFNQYYCSTFTLHYEGTQEQWSAVSIGSEYYSRLKSCTKVYSSVYTPSGDEEVKLLYSGSCGENTRWMLDSTGLLTIDGSGPMANFTTSDIPWNKYGSNYTSIINKVVVCNGVTSIGDYAFYQCTNLTYVDIADSVTSIGQSAFYQCRALEHLVLSQSVKNIGASAFADTVIRDLTIPASCESIGYGAFSGCYELRMLTLSEGLVSIGENAFSGCIGIASVTIPSSVLSIGASAFGWCDSLTGIQVTPENQAYTSVDGVLFTADGEVLVQFPGGHSATSYRIPSGVKEIGHCAFADCDKLTAVTIPPSVELIGNSAFNDADGLTSLTIPNGIRTIPQQMVYECYKLESLYIPASVEYFGLWTMKNCGNLADIYFGGTQEQWNATGAELPHKYVTMHYNWTQNVTGTCGDNLTWNLDTGTGILTISGTGDMYDYTAGTAPWYADFGDKISTLVIEEGATSIGSFAFYRCRSLENVTIADTVTAIGSDAFYYCGSLEKITLPVSITHIGDRAFSACTGLTNFNVPTRTTTIGSQAFAYTNLKTITIPGTVTFLGQDAFLESTALTDVYFDGYLTEWEALGITLEKGVSLHYKLTVMQQKWVDAHMDYIFSDAYQTDIISGYDSWMLKIFQKAQDDGGVAAYDLAKGLSEDLDFELDGVETYEVLLSMILSDRSVMNAYCDTYFENYCDSIAVTGKTLKDIGSSKNLPKDVAETIESAYKTLTESEEGSNAFFDAYETLVEQFDKHFTTEEMKAGLKKQRYMEALGLGIEGLFAAYGNLQDVLRYTENYRAYLNTSRYFKQALQTMGALANYHANSAAGPFAYNPFNDLGYWESQLNWGEFQTALNHFIEALDAYETEGAKAVAAKRVEELGETGEDILKIVGKFGLEKLLSTIPVVNGLMVAKGVLSVGVLCAEIASNVDDRKVALDMMTKAYCLSVLMDKSIESCADAMDYDALDISMVFDESVQIYVSNQNLGLDYAIKYAELRLKNAITDYRYYRITHDEVSEKKLNELKREINIFTGYIELLNMQRGRIRKIACHDPHLTYVPETDAVVSDFLDARAFVVACPVSVTVTDPRGKQMALLTDNGSQVAEGYELYFHTIPLNDGSGQHIKVAIAPKDYTVTVEGTDEGEMNAFVKDYADVSNTVSMYLDVPVKKGSKGSFRNVAQKQEPVLTMDDTNHEPIVSGPQPGDVNLDGDVTTDDAEYLLWNTLFPDLYPITADADFNNDGIRNSDDAVKLLWHAMFPEQYPLT